MKGEWLAESHRLCRETGISREITRPGDMLKGNELSAFIERHAAFNSTVRDLFIDIHLQVPDKSYVFILTDGKARILDVFALPEILEQCRRRGIRTGTSLREESSGTNAVALALRYRQPVAVRGEQHYCRLFQDWLCVATPVIRPGGEPVACVDVSSNAITELGFLLPVTGLLAKMIDEGINSGKSLPQQTASQTAAALGVPSPVPPKDALLRYGLTRRETTVAHLRLQGFTASEIAGHLNVSVNTAKTHLKSVYAKLGVTSRHELIERFSEASPEPSPSPDHPKNHPTQG